MRFALQFIFGAVLITAFIVIFLWGLTETSWTAALDTKINSMVAAFVVYTGIFFSTKKFAVYLGELNWKYFLWIFLFWTMLMISVLLVFRIPYSVNFLLWSTLSMLCYFAIMWVTLSQQAKKVIAYLPIGNTHNLPKPALIKWVKLEKKHMSSMPQCDMVMADLYADLPKAWEYFLAECALKGIPVYHSARLIESLTGRVKVDHLYENELGMLLPSKAYQTVKRVLETTVILITLPLTLPVMVLTSLLIVMESRGGVFFSQERIGQGGVSFTMYKFRSMRQGTQNDATTTKDDDRITGIGKFIRKTRIDELPQLLNVLKGEMSLIGPRAEFSKFAQEYEEKIPFYSYRHIVKPGISGWAQVLQGYNYGIDQTKVKLEYDFYYIKHFSFSLDLLILFKTIQTMITGFGAK